jgi:hypothetical protein
MKPITRKQFLLSLAAGASAMAINPPTKSLLPQQQALSRQPPLIKPHHVQSQLKHKMMWLTLLRFLRIHSQHPQSPR